MAGLKKGDRAPAFTLTDAAGKTVSLPEYAGKRVILYFYPKDDTPGCTTEACGFRDAHAAIAERNAVAIGVSPDPPESHRRFAAKFGLPFVLLCDPGHEVAKAYGAWGERNLYGKKSTGILRTTVIIEETGRIERIFRKVKAAGHAEEVLAALG